MKKNYQLLFILTSYNVYKEHPFIDSAQKISGWVNPRRGTPLSGTDEQMIPTIKHVRGNAFPRSLTTVGNKHVGFVWGQWNSEIYTGRTDKEQANPELFMEGNGIDCSKCTFFHEC